MKKYVSKLGRKFISRLTMPEVSRKIAIPKDNITTQVINEAVLADFQIFSWFMDNHDLARYLRFNKGAEIRVCTLKNKSCL